MKKYSKEEDDLLRHQVVIDIFGDMEKTMEFLKRIPRARWATKMFGENPPGVPEYPKGFSLGVSNGGNGPKKDIVEKLTKLGQQRWDDGDYGGCELDHEVVKLVAYGKGVKPNIHGWKRPFVAYYAVFLIPPTPEELEKMGCATKWCNCEWAGIKLTDEERDRRRKEANRLRDERRGIPPLI